jgi:hypothetical protein
VCIGGGISVYRILYTVLFGNEPRLSTQVRNTVADVIPTVTPLNTLSGVFIGWWRVSKRNEWLPLVEAGTLDECELALIRVVKGGEKQVLPLGRHPGRRGIVR